MHTLSGNDIYTNPKWSDPFDAQGNVDVTALNTAIAKTESLTVQMYPNPATDWINIELAAGEYQIKLLHISGRVIRQQQSQGSLQLDVNDLDRGWYLIEVTDLQHKTRAIQKIRKQ